MNFLKFTFLLIPLIPEYNKSMSLKLNRAPEGALFGK